MIRSKRVLERHISKELRELQSMPCCVEGRFAIHTQEGMQVQIVVTKEEHDMCDPENDYIREANST